MCELHSPVQFFSEEKVASSVQIRQVPTYLSIFISIYWLYFLSRDSSFCIYVIYACTYHFKFCPTQMCCRVQKMKRPNLPPVERLEIGFERLSRTVKLRLRICCITMKCSPFILNGLRYNTKNVNTSISFRSSEVFIWFHMHN